MADDGGARFAAYLTQKKRQIEDYLARFTPRPEDETSHVAGDLVRYLYEPLTRFTTSGGKRTRPALCLLGAEAVGADPICALSTAVSLEYFQSCALIHDDIADKSELRRGEPCLHITEGIGLAVNVGDLALVNVYSGLLADKHLEDSVCLRVLCELAYMQQRTLEGQALDLGWARDGRWDITVDDYLFMATSKTAYYTAATPLACGAICGGASDEQIDALFSFGLDAGLAFQLQDDLLNLTGDPEKQGKDYLSDLTEGKRTMAVLCTLARLNGKRRDSFLSIISSGTCDKEELLKAVDIMREVGSIEQVSDYARMLVDRAKGRLEGVELTGSSRKTLLSMADFFVERLG